MRCNFRKHMQIEKAPANQENMQMFTKQPNKYFYLQRVSFFLGCVVSIRSSVLSNWGSCFLNLQVFFLFAVHCALLATVQHKQSWFRHLLAELRNSCITTVMGDKKMHSYLCRFLVLISPTLATQTLAMTWGLCFCRMTCFLRIIFLKLVVNIWLFSLPDLGPICTRFHGDQS